MIYWIMTNEAVKNQLFDQSSNKSNSLSLTQSINRFLITNKAVNKSISKAINQDSNQLINNYLVPCPVKKPCTMWAQKSTHKPTLDR